MGGSDPTQFEGLFLLYVEGMVTGRDVLTRGGGLMRERVCFMVVTGFGQTFDVDLAWLNRKLQAFANYRRQKEDAYQQLEKGGYKDELLSYLQGIFAELPNNPGQCKRGLYDLMTKKPAEVSAVGGDYRFCSAADLPMRFVMTFEYF